MALPVLESVPGEPVESTTNDDIYKTSLPVFAKFRFVCLKLLVNPAADLITPLEYIPLVGILGALLA